MDYKVIAKEGVPPEEPVATDRSRLYDLFKSLPFDKAVCFKFNSWAARKEKKAMVQSLSTKFRYQRAPESKEERFKLVTQTKDEPLSPKRQAAYDGSKHPGNFRRVCYLYVWKEHLD